MKTYNDLRLEILSIPYSNDMFQIEKESAELQIMEKYLNNQIYLQENFH